MLILLVPAVVRLPGRTGGWKQFQSGGDGILKTMKISCTAQKISGIVLNIHYKNNRK
jgi:hypothetical protein